MGKETKATVRLSHLRVGDVLEFSDKPGRFIVVSRFPEDRSSGGTVVADEEGVNRTFIWDHDDPKVVHLGSGRLEARIVINELATGPPYHQGADAS
jgi:hypothetical protein